MKAVGIMTWYTYRNYGTVLQAVALNNAISNMGYKAFDIAYDPEVKNGQRKRKLGSRVFNRVRGLIPLAAEGRERAFDCFIRENLPITSPVRTDEDFLKLNEQFEGFVCGSDQIWSPRCFDSRYYLDFVTIPEKKVAYGPSFGCDAIEDLKAREDIAGLLSSFYHLSVREESGVRVVESITGRKPVMVLDPTLLLSSSQWTSITKPYDTPSRPYCLFYFLGSAKCNENAARKIAAERGMEVCIIPVLQRHRYSKGCIGTDIGPNEFLMLIQDADLIMTDSFHGMVFSALFNKEFVAFERFDPHSADSQNTRIYNLLKLLGCREALLSREQIGAGGLPTGQLLDYERINERIVQERVKSREYLREALSMATGEGR